MWTKKPSLKVLTISHHSRHKIFPRTYSMAHALVERGHQVTLLAIAEKNLWGIKESQWDGIRLIKPPTCFGESSGRDGIFGTCLTGYIF